MEREWEAGGKKRETVCAIKDFKSKYYANTSLASNGARMLKHERLAKESAEREREREKTTGTLAFSWMNYTHATFEYLSESCYC